MTEHARATETRVILRRVEVFHRVVSTIMIGVEGYQKSERYLFETQLYLPFWFLNGLSRGRNGLSMAQRGG